MKDNDNNNPLHSTSRGIPTDKVDNPLFNEFDDDYEEPDRDTDYAATYREEILEEEYDDEHYEEEAAEEEAVAEQTEELLWLDLESEKEIVQATDVDGEGFQDDEDLDNAANEASGDGFDAGGNAIDWGEDEDYVTPIPETPGWPPGLIALALVALALLIAGGYGVLQQRSAKQEEIRQLQAALATSAAPAEVAEANEALEQTVQRNSELQSVVDVLSLENRRLTDIVAGLESQLKAQQLQVAGQTPKEPPAPRPTAASQTQSEPTPEPEPEAATAPLPAAPGASSAPDQATPAPAGAGWFVNFASYGVRNTAERWVARLEPSSGKAIITTGTRNERTFYRVRVVSLPNREVAERVARELAEKHDLAKLWVGRE